MKGKKFMLIIGGLLILLALYYFKEGDLFKASISLLAFIVGAVISPHIGDYFSKSDPPAASTESRVEESESTERPEDVTDIPPVSDAPQFRYLYSDLEPFHETNGFYPNSDFEDVFGNSYSFGVIGYQDKSEGEAYQLYKIDQEYDTLSFTAVACCRSDAPEKYNAYIYIYADGELIYRNEDLNCLYYPQDVVLNIQGCDVLRIELYGEGNDYMSAYGVEACLANPKITRE